MTARLESATRQYGVDLLFSENMFNLMSVKGKEKCRKLDVVIVKGSETPIGIYTFDVNDSVILAPDEHLVGKVIPPPEISAETLIAKGTDWMFLMDQDIVQLQEGISSQLRI